MMQTHTADGWTADWLVGWLAAVGVTYRDRSIKLAWTQEATPRAVFHFNDWEQLNSILPTADELEALVIARTVPGRDEFDRNPSRESYSDRAQMARSTGDLALGATVSDIGVAAKDRLPHSPLDSTVAGGVTLGQRVKAASQNAAELGVPVLESMAGRGRVCKGNGLGFDLRRLAASCVPGSAPVTDPCAETLAFFGILVFSQVGSLARGWRAGSQFRTGAFRWPAWTEPLDWPAVDAYLAEYYSSTPVAASILIAEYESISFRPSGSDSTRGIDGVALVSGRSDRT